MGVEERFSREIVIDKRDERVEKRADEALERFSRVDYPVELSRLLQALFPATVLPLERKPQGRQRTRQPVPV